MAISMLRDPLSLCLSQRNQNSSDVRVAGIIGRRDAAEADAVQESHGRVPTFGVLEASLALLVDMVAVI